MSGVAQDKRIAAEQALQDALKRARLEQVSTDFYQRYAPPGSATILDPSMWVEARVDEVWVEVKASHAALTALLAAFTPEQVARALDEATAEAMNQVKAAIPTGSAADGFAAAVLLALKPLLMRRLTGGAPQGQLEEADPSEGVDQG